MPSSRAPRFPFSRRTFLAGMAALPAVASLWPSLALAQDLTFGDPESFSFDALRGRAKQLAASPYAPPVIRFPDVLERIDYDAYQEIRFKSDYALWADRKSV